MTVATATPVVAVFADRRAAESAVDELWHAGFRHEQIGLAGPGEPVHEAKTPIGQAEDRAAAGAALGAATGTGVGALIGAALVGMVPGIGPVLAGGLLTGIVVGGAAGAAVGSFLGPFVALGISKEEAQAYGQELKAGRTLVVVQAEDRRDQAVAILHSHGPISLHV